MNKIYITKFAPIRTHQLSFDEFFDETKVNTWGIRGCQYDTVTKVVSVPPKTTGIKRHIHRLYSFNLAYYTQFINQVREFEALPKHERYKIKDNTSKISELYGQLMYATGDEERLIQEQIAKLEDEIKNTPRYAYKTFDLRKKSAPDDIPTYRLPKQFRRTINAPNAEFSATLTLLKEIFEDIMPACYHTASFAYIKGRSTKNAIKTHQMCDNRWFAKFDFSDFFGSTTLEWLMSQLECIYPFSEIVQTNIYIGDTEVSGKDELYKALELCFLDGGLPQGTPISPLLTNIMMIPFDHIMSNELNKTIIDKNFKYTRYADDLLISCKVDFDVNKVQEFILNTLATLNAPFSLNTAKTRYGSRAGSNWNLGLMLNKDNQITVGYENKRHLKADLNNFYLDGKNGNPWDVSRTHQLAGKISYYKSIEPEIIGQIIKGFNQKYNCNIEDLIKTRIRM